jgi:hypothetical protein
MTPYLGLSYLPTTSRPTYHLKVKSSAVLVTTVLQVYCVLYCIVERRDQKCGLEQLEIQLYAILPAALLWKYPNAKSNNIGGLMTLSARSYLSPRSAKAKKKEAQKARAISWKTQLAATPTCNMGEARGLPYRPICSSQVPHP